MFGLKKARQIVARQTDRLKSDTHDLPPSRGRTFPKSSEFGRPVMSAFTKKIGVSVAVMCLAGATALASNVHLKPPNTNPTFIDQGLTLDAIGALAGLGSGDVVVSLTATDRKSVV